MEEHRERSRKWARDKFGASNEAVTEAIMKNTESKLEKGYDPSKIIKLDGEVYEDLYQVPKEKPISMEDEDKYEDICK